MHGIIEGVDDAIEGSGDILNHNAAATTATNAAAVGGDDNASLYQNSVVSN